MSKILFSLIKYLGVDADSFYRVLKTPDNKKYKTFYISKKTGGKRLIEAPIDKDLVTILEKFKKLLEQKYIEYLPSCVHGYVCGRNIISNANAHICGSHNFILKIDIKNFFNSITYERLYKLFSKIWYDKKLQKTRLDVSTLNAMCIISTCNKHLPQGSCVSPILSNMICKKMDKELSAYARKNNAIYTRYADDITFSFDNNNDLLAFIEGNPPYSKNFQLKSSLVDIFIRNKFVVNDKKVHLINKSKSQRITGIVINEKINVKRQYIRNIRALIHNVESKKTAVSKSLIGKVNFLRQVRGRNDILACKYASRINRLMKPPFPDADFILNEGDALKKYVVGIETPNGDIGSAFFSKNFLITSVHVVQIDDDSFEKTKTQLKQHGFWPSITIHYFDSNNISTLKKENHNIIDALVFNDIAFLKIDNYEPFISKELKIVDSEYVLSENCNVMATGVQNIKRDSMPILKKRTIITNLTNYFNSDVIVVEPNKIFKGMSGGPLFDLNNFKVIGVNLIGQKSDNNDNDPLPPSASIINKSSFKKASKWITGELESHLDNKVLKNYNL